jgi:geranylgeranyl diphosphate synthase type I
MTIEPEVGQLPPAAAPDHAVAPDHARAILASARVRCEPVLHASVDSLPDPLRRMAGYHFGWWDPNGTPWRTQSGKALRPALAMSTAAAVSAVIPDVVGAAAAVELVHNFSLIHDDVIDGDRTRHGRATVWAVWGKADAVLLGDALHALAGRVLVQYVRAAAVGAAIDRLESAVIEMCHGQYDDCRLDEYSAAGVGDYERMAMGKTGALMGCACALGALCAGAGEATVAAMDRFGRELGLAFQYTDDLIGIWGDPQVTGKPISDLVRHKKSLPVVVALRSGTAAARELTQLYESDVPMTAGTAVVTATLIEAAGGRRITQDHADQRVDAAIAALPDRSAATDLIALARLVAHRDR